MLGGARIFLTIIKIYLYIYYSGKKSDFLFKFDWKWLTRKWLEEPVSQNATEVSFPTKSRHFLWFPQESCLRTDLVDSDVIKILVIIYKLTPITDLRIFPYFSAIFIMTIIYYLALLFVHFLSFPYPKRLPSHINKVCSVTQTIDLQSAWYFSQTQLFYSIVVKNFLFNVHSYHFGYITVW